MRCPTRGCASSARPRKKMANAADRRLFWVTAAAVVAADVATKLLAESLLARHLPVRLIGDYMQLRLVYNPGAGVRACLRPHPRGVFLPLPLAAPFVLRPLVPAAPPR